MEKDNDSMYSSANNDTIIISGGGTDTLSYTLDDINLNTITLDSSLFNGSITAPSTLTWTQPYDNYSITSSGYSNANVILNEKGMEIKEGGDIKIGSKSLTEAIDKIEERLGILHPNPDLEERWEQLKDLRKQYVEMEKDLLEKEKIMKILKET
jgi:hypothetical protein